MQNSQYQFFHSKGKNEHRTNHFSPKIIEEFTKISPCMIEADMFQIFFLVHPVGGVLTGPGGGGNPS